MGALMEGQQSAFIGDLPKKTKTLDEKCVEIVLGFLGENEANIDMLFGSFPAMAQVMPELQRIPGDIDIQLKVGREVALRITNELFAKLEKIDRTLRINPTKLTIIETNKNGEWERAVDIHYAGEPPEDILSPLSPLEIGGKGREEFKAKDALDVYIVSKTLLESAKRDKTTKHDIKRWEGLIKRYVELWQDQIDFGKLEVKC